MRAAQAAGLELLRDASQAPSDQARVILHERFENAEKKMHASEAPDLAPSLEHATFFTEIRRPRVVGLAPGALAGGG